jgi:nucleotide-binding universal stress UspA family protein
MKALIWITEITWQACVDAARELAPAEAGLTLLYVSPAELPATARAAYTGLLGRGHPERDPGRQVAQISAESASSLLQAAAHRLGRPCTRLHRSGHTEREVVAAAEDAGLLILVRDGDLRHRGPKSLGRAGRFIVDHAPCPVLLVWPGPAPTGMPPPPPHHGHH